LSDPRLQYALARLRDEGVAVGFSTSGPHQADTIRTALDITVGGQRLFSSVQSTWNLLEPSAGPALADAHGLGVAVVVKECFANGRLAPGGDDATPAVRRAAHIAAGIGIGVDQLAIAAAIGQSWAPLVLSGAVSASQVGSHLDGAKIKLPPDVLIELAELPEEPADYWAARSRRAWT
jgi:aryl-alcohol dehydrogenase-like predicted oxidoreductase